MTKFERLILRLLVAIFRNTLPESQDPEEYAVSNQLLSDVQEFVNGA